MRENRRAFKRSSRALKNQIIRKPKIAKEKSLRYAAAEKALRSLEKERRALLEHKLVMA